jgi:hypothetical protein
MGSKGFSMHSLRSPIYGETLDHYTLAVYPYISSDGGTLLG